MAGSDPHWLNLDYPERMEFENPPLVLSICQIRFNAIMNIQNPQEIGRFQSMILDEYPLSGSTNDLEFQVEVGPRGHAVNTNEMHGGWKFYDQELNWVVSLSPDSLSLENRKYRNFNDFIGRLNRAIRALVTVFRPTIMFRIGLRYINEIRQDQRVDGDWRKTVNPRLLGLLSDDIFPSGTSQSSTQVSHMEQDGRGLNLQYGRLAGGTGVSPLPGQSIPEGEFFFLDIDVYQSFEAPRGTPLDAGAVDNFVTGFNKDVWRIFRWSVTDQYVESLEVRSK